jgi:cobyrinic acid a,c-diamide synthase
VARSIVVRVGPDAASSGASSPEVPAPGSVPVPVGVPRVVVAGVDAGDAVTVVTFGLAAVWRRLGLAVVTAGVGLATPSGDQPAQVGFIGSPARAGLGLDPTRMDRTAMAGLLREAAAGPPTADVVLVAGARSGFDAAVGGSGSGFAVTAHVARLVDAPILLVAGPRAVAVLLGLRREDLVPRVGGVILHRVGPPGHQQALAHALTTAGIPVYGALPPTPATVPGAGTGGAGVAGSLPTRAELSAGLVEAGVDADAVLVLARTAPVLTIHARR